MKRAVLGVLIGVILFAKSGEEVAKAGYEKISGYKSSIEKTTMVLKNAQGDENLRKLEIKKLEGKKGDRSLLVFLYPSDLKGTKLLSYEVIGGDDRQWLYLPALKRVKRISSRNKSGSFMASEFSYEDISSQNYKNYTYQKEAEEVEIKGRRYYKVERIPKDPHSGYSKQIIYYDMKENLPRFGEFYDKNGRVLKKISFDRYEKIGNIYRVHKITIKNVQNQKESILIWESDKIDAGLEKKDFSKRVLR